MANSKKSKKVWQVEHATYMPFCDPFESLEDAEKLVDWVRMFIPAADDSRLRIIKVRAKDG